MNKIPQNIMALASIVQTTALVNELANYGQCDSKSCDASINSLIKSGNDINTIYNEYDDLSIGLLTLRTILEKSSANKNIILYSLSLIKLEKALMKENEVLRSITSSIDEIKNSTYFSINHQNSIEKLANIYTNSLGRLQPKIIINGKKSNLKNPNITNYIRALLLAGVRSVSLWRSNGNNNIWSLIFNKHKIIKQLKSINA